MTHLSPQSVVCIGAVHYDTLAHARVDIHPETSTPAVFSGKPGGVATNVARSLNRLGTTTKLVGALGDDSAANILASVLEAEGVDLDCVRRPGFSTGQYIALHNPDGSLAAACVDDRVLGEAPADLFDARLENASSAFDEAIWFIDANLPQDLLHQVVAWAPSKHLIANAVSNAKAPRFKSVLRDLTCLMLNRGEAIALTGSDAEKSNSNLITKLLNLGANQIVMTDGANKVTVYDGRNILALAPRDVDIVDVTGAGDALTAGTIAAMARGYNLPEAVSIGLKAANLTLRTTGALAEDLSWETLQKL
ncbi:MAG: PfkB family carbohydrate kinase [Roseibium sp.]